MGWIDDAAQRIAGHAERELEALVAVSSPSGDSHGSEEALAVCAALLPDAAPFTDQRGITEQAGLNR